MPPERPRRDMPPRSNTCLQNERSIPFFIRGHPIYPHYTYPLPYNEHLKKRARLLRKAGVLTEVLFWKQVHRGKFWNIDFDRQQIIDNYIVDFYVKSLSLVIEIDGSSHNGREEYDAQRQAYLESLGLVVYRVEDKEVRQNIQGVITALEEFIVERYSRPV